MPLLKKNDKNMLFKKIVYDDGIINADDTICFDKK